MISLSDAGKKMPKEAYLCFPKESDQFLVTSKVRIRIMYDGQIQLEEREWQCIKDFKEYLKDQSTELGDWWTDSRILRFLYALDFRKPEALKAIREYTMWRKKALPPVLNPAMEKILKSGLVYMQGRDNKFRPIITLCVNKIDYKEMDIDDLIDAKTYFLYNVAESFFLDGQVENWVIILDLKDMGITNLPYQALKKVLGNMQNNYRSRLFRLFMVNTPKTISFIWKTLSSFIEETTKLKIKIVNGPAPEELFTFTNRSQIEEKYGGTAPPIEDYSWPPKLPAGDNFINSEDRKGTLIDEEEYIKMWKEGLLNKNSVNKEILGLDK